MAHKVALIPGGVKGIGKEIALRLADRGWAVALCYRTSHEEAESTRAELAQKGAEVMIAAADVSDAGTCKRLFADVCAWKGRVDALIHCAGPYHRVDLLEETAAGWREMLAGNLDSLFHLSQLVAPGMMERRWGRIIAFSMANADRVAAQTQITAHYIAKTGVLGLVRGLAKRLAPYDVTVNAVSPGFIDSGSMPAEELQGMKKHIPAGRFGTVDDVAGAVLFLMSDDASYVNGSSIPVSGGWGL